MTAAQRRCLGNIIAQGGAHVDGNGRDFVGYVRTSVVSALAKLGYVELGMRKPLRNGYLYETWYATAAGCIAYGAEVAVAS